MLLTERFIVYINVRITTAISFLSAVIKKHGTKKRPYPQALPLIGCCWGSERHQAPSAPVRPLLTCDLVYQTSDFHEITLPQLENGPDYFAFVSPTNAPHAPVPG